MAANGGERLDLKVGGQSLGLTANSLIPILVLIIAGVAGYLVWLSQDGRFQQMHQQHVYLVQLIEHQNALIQRQTETLRRWLEVVSYNMGKEGGERLPLEVPPPPPEPPGLPGAPTSKRPPGP